MQDLLQDEDIVRPRTRVVGRSGARPGGFSMRPVPRRLLITALAALLGVLAAGHAAGQSDIAGQRRAADQLRDAVAAESARIASTRDGLADAERRLGALDARVERRREELADAQDELVRSRIRLTKLQHREAAAKRVLAENLVESYKAGQPELVSIVLSSNGFADLFHRLEYLKRQSRSNARILDDTREARADVAVETRGLEKLRTRYSELARAAIADRDEANVLRNALLEREAAQLARLAGAQTRLANVRTRIRRLQREHAVAARQAAASQTATAEAPPPAPGAGGDVVGRVVAAANEIATTPYVWGGGHGGASGGYDCSGSISYALAAAGLLAGPLDSTGFMSWGEAGPGRRITVYANPGHAFMVVDGRRFDTSALSGGGTRWTSASRSTAGFVARHPPGL
jgi:cell wall-associated NlpC family hydrolase